MTEYSNDYAELNRSETVTSVSTDHMGGAFITGHTRGDLSRPNAGDRDAFLARFDGDGSLLWISQFGTPVQDRAHSVAADGAGGAFVAGDTRGSLGGPITGGFDAFLALFPGDSCYPDCDGDGRLGFEDFVCFQGAFMAADPYADCDGNGVLDFFDFLCFQNAFLAGCA